MAIEASMRDASAPPSGGAGESGDSGRRKMAKMVAAMVCRHNVVDEHLFIIN